MLNKLLDIINRCGGTWSMRNKVESDVQKESPILVSIDDFFDDIPPNEYYFATNSGFGDAAFYALFKEMKEKKAVQDLWIEIYDYDPDEDDYPYAEVCYIAASSSSQEVYKWFGDKAFPSSISLCDTAEREGLPLVEEGYLLFCCWWD